MGLRITVGMGDQGYVEVEIDDVDRGAGVALAGNVLAIALGVPVTIGAEDLPDPPPVAEAATDAPSEDSGTDYGVSWDDFFKSWTRSFS